MEKAYQTRPAQALKGSIEVAPDKSISHRALIFAAIANGESKIKNLLLSEDVLRTLTIINQLGIQTSHTAETLTEKDELVVYGKGLQGLTKPENVLCCGNSGTTMRLMMGLLAGQPFQASLIGDDSLNKRPMDRVIEPLQEMGATINSETVDEKRIITVLPQNESGEKYLKGISYVSPVASAQVKSAIILAGLYARKPTSVVEPRQSRNHTELMLKSLRGKVAIKDLMVTIDCPTRLKALNVSIPGDLSSAAAFIAAALIVKGSDLTISNVNLNSTRTGMIDVLRYMGAKITTEIKNKVNGEDVGRIHIEASRLKNLSITGNIIPRMIDEIPMLALIASVSEGKMVVSGAEELRVKESDRIKAICKTLQQLGVRVDEKDDGFIIVGNPEGLRIQEGVDFRSYGDHRIAMMQSIAGLVLDKAVTIDDVSCVDTSFPGFFRILEKF
ncbi:3-phosphoshikimate 1-carboxyvinyltransferase [bacterium]|nr:3-phosphoshikimate 1-carboxyvinyltransferase [bacterium]MBU1917584.1 3-phosphoshikimate 1-carboxyvinyltransferase [bacterium]